MKLVLNRECVLFGASPKIVEQLKTKLSFPNPAYAEARKHGRWTGNIDRVLIFYKELGPGQISFPRGFMREALGITGRSLVFQDDRRTLPEVDFRFYGKLRPYQEVAVEVMLKKHFGVLEASCGSGKTVCALAVIAQRKQPTLVVVSTVELLNQWCDMIDKFLAVNAGRIGNGKFEIKPITVGIVNTVVSHLTELPQHFGQIVFDEVHRMSCPRMIAVAKEFDCKMMFSCSATPYRQDGLSRVIHFYAGPLVHKIDPSSLQDIGAVLIPEIIYKQTDFHYNFRDDYTKMLSTLTQDETRNTQITQDVLKEVKTGSGTVLVVSDRVEHCQTLAGILENRKPGLRVGVLTGQLKSKDRASLVEDIRNGVVEVLIATLQLISEGVDFPELSSLFLGTPIRFSGRLIQTVGRILRPADGKQPRVYDYLDNKIGPLYSSAKARQAAYRNMHWLK